MYISGNETSHNFAFPSYWLLPNCLGALDGKHIIFQDVPNGSSLYLTTKVYILILPIYNNCKIIHISYER